MEWHSHEAKNWEHLIRILGHFDLSRPYNAAYLYRGQSVSGWTLRSTLCREFVEPGKKSTAELRSEALRLELEGTKAFHQHAPVYLGPGIHSQLSHPERNPTGLWILMRHYGAPTRLLDWSFSWAVAAYFAVSERFDEDGAIWLVHQNTLAACSRQQFQTGEFRDWLRNSDDAYRSPESDSTVWTVKAGAQNTRSAAQQGAFTLCGRILQDHTDAISELGDSATPPDKTVAAKIAIPKKIKRECLRRLWSMNVTARSLFPEIDGLGRSITESIRLARGPDDD